MKFGIPNQKKRREEKYPTIPVLTLGIDGGKGKSKTMILNSEACRQLKLDDKNAKIAFSFDGGNYIANADQPQIPDEYGIRVSKTNPRRISDKKTYDYFSKLLGLDNTVENEFELLARVSGIDEPNTFELVLNVVRTRTVGLDENEVRGINLADNVSEPEQETFSMQEEAQETE